MARRYYIAYGSNLNIDQMKWRCPDAEIVGTGEIKDYELLFKGSKTGAYLTVEKKKGEAVPVGIWSVTSEDEKALDRYEGCPNFYYKTNMSVLVKTRNGRQRELNCFVYIMHEDRLIEVPSKRYIYTCLCGYGDFGFSNKALYAALEKSWRCKANGNCA